MRRGGESASWDDGGAASGVDGEATVDEAIGELAFELSGVGGAEI